MKKTLLAVLLVVCFAVLYVPVRAAEPVYDTTVTIDSGKLEDLQAKLDSLPESAGDVQVEISQSLFSSAEKLELSVPTDKGVTSLTLTHQGEDTVSIWTGGTNLDFFANGIPLVIDKGVNFGKLPQT